MPLTIKLVTSRLLFAKIISLYFTILLTSSNAQQLNENLNGSYYYNDEIITSIETQLEFDENRKLSSYHFVYPATQNPKCVSKIIHNQSKKREADSYFGQGGLSGEALRRVFPDYDENNDGDDGRCLAACIEKGTDASVAGYTAPQFHYDSSSSPDGESIESWFKRSCEMVEVCFVNRVVTSSQTEERKPLSIYWMDRSTGTWMKQLELEYGSTRCFDSFLGHEFLAVLESSPSPSPALFYYNNNINQRLFEERITIEYTTMKAFGTTMEDEEEDNKKTPPPTLSPVSHHHLRSFFDQPQQQQKTTETLFEHDLAKHFTRRTSSPFVIGMNRRLPNDVFANMGAYYYNNRKNVVREEWSGNGSFVSWWEENANVLSIPWKIKEKWQNRLSMKNEENGETKKLRMVRKRNGNKKATNQHMQTASPTYTPAIPLQPEVEII